MDAALPSGIGKEHAFAIAGGNLRSLPGHTPHGA